MVILFSHRNLFIISKIHFSLFCTQSSKILKKVKFWEDWLPGRLTAQLKRNYKTVDFSHWGNQANFPQIALFWNFRALWYYMQGRAGWRRVNLEETKGFIGHDSLCMPFFKWATTFQAGMNRTCSSVVLATVTSFGANLSSKKTQR